MNETFEPVQMSEPELTDYSIVVAGHGSKDPAAIVEFEETVRKMRMQASDRLIESGFLEFARPNIAEAVRSTVAKGARRIVVVPALLCAATHAKNDMPGELLALKQEFPEIELHFGAAMDLHPNLLNLCRERIVAAESSSEKLVHRADTCLVVVGRGTSDPDANSEISKLTRMLEEGMGFGTSFVCYSGTAKPLVADGLKAAARLGLSRIIVLPYFLFDGVLVKRIYQAADALAQRYPELEVIKAGYLGPDESVAAVFLERAREGVEGRAHMNCSLCKYRVQLVGFERQQGEPQKPHHLAVRGGELVDPSKATLVHNPYQPHEIEAESFRIIQAGRDWSDLDTNEGYIAQRLVHTSGDFSIVEDLFFSPGAVESGMSALLRCRQIVTDVTMVESGLKRALVEELCLKTWCGVHDKETHLLSQSSSITRSAAGIRRAWQIFGNDVVLAIGDAPTAVVETVRLIREHGWRPQLVIGLPVGFVGTRESKSELRRCLQVPRITNSGTRGGSPWAASVINALMILAINKLAAVETSK